MCKCTDSISGIRENIKSSNKYPNVNRWVFVARIFFFQLRKRPEKLEASYLLHKLYDKLTDQEKTDGRIIIFK